MDENKTMIFTELSQKLLRKELVSFPESISIPSESKSGFLSSKNIFREKIAELRKYTDVSTERFSKEHTGSTGWEYEMMMLYFDGKFYYSAPTTSKNYEQVSSSHSWKVDTDFEPKTGKVTDKLIIDGKQAGIMSYLGKEQVEKRNARLKQGDFIAGFVCHFHSHPQVQMPGRDKRIYTFFSPTDINSLLHGRTPLMGLITDRLWLLAKPIDNRTAPTPQELMHVTQTEADEPAKLEQVAGELMRRYGWNLYVGGLGASTLTRV